MNASSDLACPERVLAPGERLPKAERASLSPAALMEIQRLAVKYPDKLSATIPSLHVVQADLGFVGLDAMKIVAELLDVPESHVYGVATFYTLFHKRPVGKFHLQMCTNLCCALRGADALFQKLCDKLGVRPGDVSPDGMWSVEEVECLGSCGSGPCLQVNSNIYDEFLDDAKLDAILHACQSGEVPEWGQAEKSTWGQP